MNNVNFCLEGKFLDFPTTCKEFIASNYNPAEDEIVFDNGECKITKLGVIYGDTRYADSAHVAFSFVAMPGTQYAGTTFGGMSMTKELYAKLYDKYGWQLLDHPDKRARLVNLSDYSKFHNDFVAWCAEMKISLLGWCYGQYIITDWNKPIPFWTDGIVKITYYKYERSLGRDVVVDSFISKAIFVNDVKWLASNNGPKEFDYVVASINGGYNRLFKLKASEL